MSTKEQEYSAFVHGSSLAPFGKPVFPILPVRLVQMIVLPRIENAGDDVESTISPDNVHGFQLLAFHVEFEVGDTRNRKGRSRLR